jgi:hypothetical protein
VWQQLHGASFIAALNSGAETFPGISYTEIYTHTDEVVQPAGSSAGASAALHTGGGTITNVATQDICPLDVDEHLVVGTADPVAYALAVDALTHPGPADPARIPKSVCSQVTMPGVNPVDLGMYLSILEAAPGLAAVDLGGVNLVGAPEVRSEPPLDCYVFADCPAAVPPTRPSGSTGTAGTTTGTAGPACTSARNLTLHLPTALRRAVVTVNGRRVHVRGRPGHLRVHLELRAGGPATLVVVISGVARQGRLVEQTRRYRPCAAAAMRAAPASNG